MTHIVARFSFVLLFVMAVLVPSPSWAQGRAASDSRQGSSNNKSRTSRLNPVEKKNLKLPPFPKPKEGETIEDRLLMLKKRLDHLHHILYARP